MEHREGELASWRGVEEADVAERLQRLRAACLARMSITVIWASALASVSKIFIWSDVEVMSTTSVMFGWNRFERALRRLGVEGARLDVVRDEIVEQRSRHGCLADAALIRSNQNHRKFCHELLLPRIARYVCNDGCRTRRTCRIELVMAATDIPRLFISKA